MSEGAQGVGQFGVVHGWVAQLAGRGHGIMLEGGGRREHLGQLLRPEYAHASVIVLVRPVQSCLLVQAAGFVRAWWRLYLQLI